MEFSRLRNDVVDDVGEPIVGIRWTIDKQYSPEWQHDVDGSIRALPEEIEIILNVFRGLGWHVRAVDQSAYYTTKYSLANNDVVLHKTDIVVMVKNGKLCVKSVIGPLFECELCDPDCFEKLVTKLNSTW